MLSDLKFAARTLRQAPGVAAAAVLALALGIGASTAIFSVLDGVLYKPLPFPHPEQDPLTYGGVAALLVSVAVVASWVPARRATRVDPAIALRAE